MKKKKKKKKKPELQRIQDLTDPLPVSDSVGRPETFPAEDPETAPSTTKTVGQVAPRGRRRGGFFWGLGLGFLATLIFIVATGVTEGGDAKKPSSVPSRAVSSARPNQVVTPLLAKW